MASGKGGRHSTLVQVPCAEIEKSESQTDAAFRSMRKGT